MRIKKDYIKVQAYDGWVVTPIGEESKKKKIMLTLNNSAAEIWDMIAAENSKENIVSALVEKYGISEEKAFNDVEKIIDTLVKEGIVE